MFTFKTTSMKNNLLLLIGMLLSQFVLGQQFTNEDFSSFTLGNIGTDLTGSVTGQGGYLTTATNGIVPTTTNNTANENFQIVNQDVHGKVLQITGPNGDKGNRFFWKTGLSTAWANRTAGNNIIEIEYDFYTGDATVSKNNMRLVVYDATKTKVLTGFSYNTGTKILSGVGYYDATPLGGTLANNFFPLGVPVGTTPTEIVIPSNTWIRLGMSYNYTTGIIICKGSGFNVTLQGSAPMTTPDQVNVVSSSGTGTSDPNTTFAVVSYDNISVLEVATDSLLETDSLTTTNPLVVIYPNPTKDWINISNQRGNIELVQITDLNGRLLKSKEFKNLSKAEINLSDFQAGVYLMNVFSDKEKFKRKIIKE